MQLIILASGRGSRLKEKTKKIPKSLLAVNKIPLIEYNLKFYKYFTKKIIVVGYKKDLIIKKLKNYDFLFYENKKYSSTNMVESMFCCHKMINEDVVICYSDIIFDHKIINNLRSKYNIMPVYKNWLNLWKKRMDFKKIINDAEGLKIHNGFISSIGFKIDTKLPKYQFMGIIKLNKKDYSNLKNYYFKTNNKKIDFTNFINLAVKNNVIKIKTSVTKKYWYEVDTKKDLRVVEKSLKTI